MNVIFLFFQVSFDQVLFTCHRCWQRINTAERAQQAVGAVEIDHIVNEDDNIPVPLAIPVNQRNLARASNTASHCIFRDCLNESRLRIPNSRKAHMLSYYNFYIPPSARVCNEHIMTHDWDQLLSGNVSQEFNVDHILDIISIYRTALENPSTMFDFDLQTVDENELRHWTGLTIVEFNSLLEQTPSLRQRSNVPNVVLGGYLMKLRTGEPNVRLASLLKISRRTFERQLVIARECLLADFVPSHLGFDHISRNEALTKNLLIPNALFGDENNSKLISICDGTYIYIQKSSNFLFQRRSYSLHKYRNLLKPFLIVCSNGYIIDVTGPYAATTSDATIMSNILNDHDNTFHWFYLSNDVFILDRGFRDALPDFEACGYDAHMPPSKDRNSQQLSTEQANKSRLITIVRWVVEVVNGRFKRDFKFLRADNFNRAVPHMFEHFRIAAALINAFHLPIRDNAYANAIITIINERIHFENHLAQYVIQKNLNMQRVVFTRMAAYVPGFEDIPQLEEEHLVLIALGTYHIKIASSYCAEHLSDGTYVIELYRDNELEDLNEYNIEVEEGSFLLRARIQSRHTRSKQYYTYVLINSGIEGRGAFKHYYCTCLTGRRTIGTCAHVISILWYLCWARHQEGLSPPAAHLNNVIIDTSIM